MRALLAMLVLLAGLGLQPPPARAATDGFFPTVTIGELLTHCASTVTAYAQTRGGEDVIPKNWQGSWDLGMTVGVCQGYIEGFWFASALVTKSGSAVSLFNLICLPEEATTEMLANAFVTWGRANPEKATESSATGVYRAWRETWPCSKIVQQ